MILEMAVEGCDRGKNGGEKNTRKKKNGYDRRTDGMHAWGDKEKGGRQS